MWVKVDIPGRLSGKFRLAPVTVIMGPPRSGKTTLLKLIYSAFYAASRGVVPAELQYYLESVEALRISFCFKEEECEKEAPALELVCTKNEERGCSLKGAADIRPFYLPPEYELLVKYNIWLPHESYSALMSTWINLVHDVKRILPQTAPECVKEYLKVVEGDALEGKFEFRSRGWQVYEVAHNAKVPFTISSTTVAKLGVLEQMFIRGLTSEYDIFLFDNPEAGLHPLGQARLALLIHSLATCEKKVVVATHDVMFLDMLRRTEDVNRIFNTDLEAEASLYMISEGKIEEVDTATSYIKDYTEYIYAVYGYDVKKAGDGAAVARKRASR